MEEIIFYGCFIVYQTKFVSLITSHQQTAFISNNFSFFLFLFCFSIDSYFGPPHKTCNCNWFSKVKCQYFRLYTSIPPVATFLIKICKNFLLFLHVVFFYLLCIYFSIFLFWIVWSHCIKPIFDSLFVSWWPVVCLRLWSHLWSFPHFASGTRLDIGVKSVAEGLSLALLAVCDFWLNPLNVTALIRVTGKVDLGCIVIIIP